MYQWLEIGSGNPFNARVLDIRPLTQTVTATTQNPDVAKRFLELRESDGSDLANTSADGWISVACSLEVAFPTAPIDGPLYKAAQMEDKWDIYAYDSALYFSRSWTEILIYKAIFRRVDRIIVINTIDSAPNYSDKADQAVLFLLVSHVLGRPFPNPIPTGVGDDTEQIALHSFSSYGRNALYATLGDVTSLSV